MEETKMIVTISNENPIELVDFTQSFLGLATQYKSHSHIKYSTSSKLYIKEVRQGSAIFELVELTKVAILPIFGDVNTIVEFAKHLGKAFDYFSGKGKKENTFSIKDLQDLKDILKPAANNSPSTNISFNVIVNGNVTVNNYTVTNTEANAIQNNINKEIKLLEQTMPTFKEKALFYWYAAKNDLRSQSWERGIIESIYKNNVKVIFDTEDIKNAMIHPPKGSIFDLAFIVDVRIETVDGGRPVLYNIVNFHGYLEKNDGDQTQFEIT